MLYFEFVFLALEHKIQLPIDCETATEYCAVLFVSLSEYIEDIQIFGMNMPFISLSEVKYTFSRFTR